MQTIIGILLCIFIIIYLKGIFSDVRTAFMFILFMLCGMYQRIISFRIFILFCVVLLLAYYLYKKNYNENIKEMPLYRKIIEYISGFLLIFIICLIVFMLMAGKDIQRLSNRQKLKQYLERPNTQVSLTTKK